MKRLTVASSFRVFDFHPKTIEGKYVVQMFGINEMGESCSIYGKGFKPFFFVHIPDDADMEYANDFKDLLFLLCKDENESMPEIQVQLVQKHDLYRFTNNKMHNFIQCTFKNEMAMRQYRNLWYEPLPLFEIGERVKIKSKMTNSFGMIDSVLHITKKAQYYNVRIDGGTIERNIAATDLVSLSPNKKDMRNETNLKPILWRHFQHTLYESNIPPILRMFHIHNISPTGWIRISKRYLVPMMDKSTRCTYEYDCPIDAIVPMPEKETMVPFKICSFDIEASSSHGDFPLAMKTYKRLARNLVDSMEGIYFQGIALLHEFILKAILHAFGQIEVKSPRRYTTNIDPVYPISPPTKEALQSCIQTFFALPIQDMKPYLATEKGQWFLKRYGLGKQIVHDDDEDEDSDDEENKGSEEKKKRKFETSTISYAMPKKVSTSSSTSLKPTILDMLLDGEKYSREDKIFKLDLAMAMADFPDLKGDEVTFIGSTFLRYGSPQPYRKHCLMVSNESTEDPEIRSCKSEKTLLLRWRQLILEEDPDIIIGYNIFGFDYDFLFLRAIETSCVYEFAALSRESNKSFFQGKYSVVKDGKKPEYSLPCLLKCKLEESKVALATGEYNLKYPYMPGRLQIDLYTFMRREYQLASYKLDDVASQFISDDIFKVEWIPGTGSTHLYSRNLMGLAVHDYIHIELTNFTSDYFDHGRKFLVIDILSLDGYSIIVIEGEYPLLHETGRAMRWGMAKNDITPQDIFRLSQGSLEERLQVARYCLQDCNLVQHLMRKLDVLTGFMEMASICNVPISFLVFRGQGIKLTSFVAKKCREKNTLLKDLPRNKENEGYEGAIVLPPKCGMYMDLPVACVDYSSLYPSSMICNNLSHDSLVFAKTYNLDGLLVESIGDRDPVTLEYFYDQLPEYRYIDLQYDNFEWRSVGLKKVKTKVGFTVCRWAQFPEGRKAVMPSILEELLKARSDTKRRAKGESDAFMQNVLDKRQLAYKMTANSLYGQCGAATSTFYNKMVAACTTAFGRKCILYTRQIIEEIFNHYFYVEANLISYAKYIYGDTDSVFFAFHFRDASSGENVTGKRALIHTIELAQEVARLSSIPLLPPMDLAYEKTLMPFILLSKKRYVGQLYETNPEKGKMKFMGLALKRRDSCDYLKDIYGGILNILMKSNDVKEAITFLNQSLEQLRLGRVSASKLLITKALRSDYKNPQQIAHCVLANRIGKRDPGNKPKPGDRMQFLHIMNSDKKALQGDCIETPEFIAANKLPIDYGFYITNQLLRPLQQLFGLNVAAIYQLQGNRQALLSYNRAIDALIKECRPDSSDEAMASYMKQKEKMDATKVKEALFNNTLMLIKQNQQSISSFFSSAKKHKF